ncbi:LexA repressor [compost metagenome]
MSELTTRERQALKAITDYYTLMKYSPTIREIGKAMGLASTSTVYGYLERLEKKGYIERRESSPRALRVIRHAE